MNEKCMTDQDNGMAQRHREQPVQQRMSAMLTTLFSAGKELTVLFKQYHNNILGCVQQRIYQSR